MCFASSRLGRQCSYQVVPCRAPTFNMPSHIISLCSYTSLSTSSFTLLKAYKYALRENLWKQCYLYTSHALLHITTSLYIKTLVRRRIISEMKTKINCYIYIPYIISYKILLTTIIILTKLFIRLFNLNKTSQNCNHPLFYKTITSTLICIKLVFHSYNHNTIQKHRNKPSMEWNG